MSFKEFSSAQTSPGSNKEGDKAEPAAPTPGAPPAVDEPADSTPPAK